MNEDLRGIFDKMHLNKFYAGCITVSSTVNKIVFDKPFTQIPDVFVVSNKIVIEYGSSGSLQKMAIDVEASTKDVTFTTTKAQQLVTGPVCVLAIDKSGIQ